MFARLQQPTKQTDRVITCRRSFSTSASGLSDALKDELLVERREGDEQGIVIVSMNRPKAKNAIGRNLAQRFRETVDELQFDKDARVVILQSVVDGVFCAGADLKERKEMSQQEAAKFVTNARKLFTDLSQLPMPTISVIEGAALGGGLEMALSTDLRVSGSKAIIGLPETGLAIIPGAGGTQRLPRLIGAAKAKELIFTSARLSSEEALEYGIVNRAVESGQGLEAALDIAKKINKNGPIAIRMAKQAIDKGMQVDEASGMFIEQQCYAQVIPTKDRLEGLAAFKEKRAPQYKGE
eukprot:TRINITY_DN5851_c1_g1_i1.p1 TRINITY_DN5851_c1_g1~~TRINITY_DN5851_c1_g1_i1.p1  ORF type:complete len:296 (-),score=114.69 TRINITY_DN5851_c1_g1_i1:25-912(-)